MYTFAYDLETGAMVGLKSGGVCTDADYEGIVDATKQFWAEATVDDFASLILVIDAEQPPPSPSWRKRLAEAREPTRPFRSAIVSPSAVERGMITAINWMKPPAAGQKIVPFASFVEAVAWIEEEGGRPRPVLRALYAKARAHAQSVPGLKASRRSGSRG